MPQNDAMPFGEIKPEIVVVDRQRLIDFEKQLPSSRGQKSLLAYLKLGELKVPQFKNEDFRKLNLSDADLSGVEFIDCNFEKARFLRATLREVNASRSNFTKAHFSDAYTVNSIFSGSTLDHAHFNRGVFFDNNLSSASLENIIFDGNIETNLTKDELRIIFNARVIQIITTDTLPAPKQKIIAPHTARPTHQPPAIGSETPVASINQSLYSHQTYQPPVFGPQTKKLQERSRCEQLTSMCNIL